MKIIFDIYGEFCSYGKSTFLRIYSDDEHTTININEKLIEKRKITYVDKRIS